MTTGNGAEVDVRVQDYLNDKFQTEADLQSLDTLLESVRYQQELLRTQLKEANDALESASAASQSHEASLRSQVDAFQAQQADIDKRLKTFTQSDKSDDAVKSFEKSMEKLRRLDIATGYMEILRAVDQSSSQALASLKSSPRSSIAQYTRLSNLGATLKQAQSAAEGAAPHLVHHLDQHCMRLGADLKRSFEDDLKRTLDKIRWPQKEIELSGETLLAFADQVDLLLELQEPELKMPSELTDVPQLSIDPPILFPLEPMVQPLELRFRYHFSGDRPTNRLDKPEYFLSHILDLLETHNDFLLDYVQPILDRRSRSSADNVDLIYTDAVSSFITALLPMTRKKILSYMPQTIDHPQLLSHFVHELMKFDDALRESWGYIPVPSTFDSWKGLTWEVLVTHEYFEPWLRVEKEFALARYISIVNAKDCDELDYDSLESGTSKPTKGAMRVNDLLETVTERYRPLSSFSQKIRFLIDVQIEIFDRYHQRLYESLNNHPLRQSSLTRSTATDNADATTSPSSIPGLDRLLRIFGSASFLENKMLDWSDDVFFLELWDELSDRARQNSGTNRSVARDLSTAQIASRTSSVINGRSAEGEEANETENGALFDETASTYRRLRIDAESLIIESLNLKLRNALKPYSRLTTWSSLTPASPSPTPSAELDVSLSILSSSLSLLSRTLSPASVWRIVRPICLALQEHIWNNVLTRQNFSTAGATQLRTDIDAICGVVDEATKTKADAERGMRKLREGVRLLGLPIRAGKGKDGRRGEEEGTEAEAEEDGWGLDEDEGGDADGDGEGGDTDEDGEKIWGLWEVERRVFQSNESAREVLAKMGLEMLSESEARMVLERRVEVGS